MEKDKKTLLIGTCAILTGSALYLSLLRNDFHQLYQNEDKKSSLSTVETDVKRKEVLPTTLIRKKQAFFIGETGHSLYGAFFEYWRMHRRERFLGNPISEVYTAPGKSIQYFEHMILEKNEQGVKPRRVDTLILSHPAQFFKNEVTSIPLQEDSLPEHPAMYRFFQKNGRDVFFGTPKAVLTETSGNRYYLFEHALLSVDESADGIYEKEELDRKIEVLTPEEVTFIPLGKIFARMDRIETTPVSESPFPLYANTDWDRKVEVSLDHQTATLFEDSVAIQTIPISSGRSGWETPKGTYTILEKRPTTTMSIPGVYAPLYHVPYNMKFAYGRWGYAIYLHGAYWHNEFGKRKSLGCINFEPDDAKYVYEWASLGTPVVVKD